MEHNREAPLYHLIFVLLIITINAAVMKLSRFTGIIFLPVSVYVCVFFILRMAAPKYIKWKIMNHLDKNNGRVSREDLFLNFFNSYDDLKLKENRLIFQSIMDELEKAGHIRMDSEYVCIVSRPVNSAK